MSTATDSAAVVRTYGSLSHSDLENLIEDRLIGTLATDRGERLRAFGRMGELIALRTPETVARMEQAKGLR